jgi:tripartite-type tricarboxylate transporter receptor subunit TctC
MLKNIKGLLLLSCLFISFSTSVNAQSIANGKPIRIIVGVTTGGTTDNLARYIANELSKELKQSVFVENKPGAGGNIAAQFVAKAPSDGLTLLFVNTSHSVNAGLYGDQAGYDPVKDFTPITLLSTGPAVLVANPSFPANNVKELIALAKAKPGKLNFAIGGVGTSLHMAGELFKHSAQVDITNIPYKGSSPALTDVMAGQVELMFAAVINAVPQVKAGKLKALGVTGNQRIPALPDAPPISETIPGYESTAYFGLLAPANLPKDVLEKISKIAMKASGQSELKNKLEPDGSKTVGSTPDEFKKFLIQDVDKWKRVVKATGAQP